MSVLAFKALSYGADKIPDKIFESVPGGFFTPEHKQKTKTNRRPLREKEEDNRRRSEQRYNDRGRRRSQRERTPPTEYSDHDTDYERERRRKERRHRAKSLGRSLSRSISRSLSRGRHQRRSKDSDGEYEQPRSMDMADRAERGPQFPPPPGSEYRPYDPRDYAPPGAAATGAPTGNGYHDPYDRRASSAKPDYGYPPQPTSASAARYTPASGYAPSPVNAYPPAPGYVPSPINANTPLPPPNAGYAPYNPADYASSGYKAPGNAYPSPPPFYRQESRSQPSFPQNSYPESQTQVAVFDPPTERHGSSASSRRRQKGDDKRHRARSAGHHGRSRSRVTDQIRDRFENIDLHDKNLAASVGGALAGGLAGNAVGHGTLSTLIGAGIGAFGGREFEKRHEKKKTSRTGSQPERSQNRRDDKKRDSSRSPSRDRRRDDRFDDDDSYSDSDSDHRRGSRRRRGRRGSDY